MPVNRDDVKGGLSRGKRQELQAQAHAYRATGTLPSTTFADPIATLPVKHPARLEQDVKAPVRERRSRTTAPAGSATAALINATGGSYAFDRPATLRPEDIATLKAFHKATGSPSAQLDFALGFGLGVKPSTAVRAVAHPLRFAEHNRKDFEASGYRSADLTPTNLIASSALLGAPLASKIERAGAAKGLETRFVGGAAKDEAPAVGSLEAAVAHAKQAAEAQTSKLPAGAEDVTARLGGAARLRVQQERGYSQERGKRIADYEQKLKTGLAAGLDPEAAHRSAMGALSGELPKLEFTAGKELSRDNLPDLFRHIQEHPGLRPYERLNTRDALLNIFEGKVPTRSEIKLLTSAFGENDANALAGSVDLWKKLGNTGLDLLNVPRALKSSFDLSAPFRQGLVLGARHPRMFASEFKPMLKSFVSENAYKDVMDEIVTRPTFQAMRESKLALTDLENLTNREESFASNLAEYVPGVRASGRAYVAFLNKFRADAFDNYVRLAESQGLDTSDPHLLASISKWVNYATGRGGQSKFVANHAVGLNATFFSPRLIASRVNLLFNPVFYAQLDPFARKQALRGMAQLVGGVSLTLWLAKMAGAQVGLDPRSADFGKIKVGNTRVDVMGGFQQYFVLAARMYRGETVSSTTGAVEHLTGGFGKSSRGTLVSRFAQQKFAPIPGFAAGWLNNENFAGQPFHPLKEAAQLVAPLGPQNAVQTFKSEGPAAAAVGLGLGSIGFGVQTYGLKQDKNYKTNNAEIDKALKAGKIDAKTAHQLRQQNDVQHREWVHEQTLLKNGHSQGDVERSLVIEYAKKNSMPPAELENLLRLGGYKPLHDGEYR